MLDNKKIVALLKCFRLLTFNKNNYGEYIRPSLLAKIDFDVTEKEIDDFMRSFNRLPSFPGEGLRHYDTLNSIFVMGIPVAEIAKKEGVDRSAVYRHRDKAIQVLTLLYEGESYDKKEKEDKAFA